MGSAMLMGEASRMSAVFLSDSADHELDPVGVQQEHDDAATSTQPPAPARLIVDALVTAPASTANTTTRWYCVWVVSWGVVVGGCLLLGQRYIRLVLHWLQGQELGAGLAIFTLLFFLISFPFFLGNALLMLAAGYLYGCVRGPLVVIGCGGLGLGGANLVMRAYYCRSYLRAKLLWGKVRAMLKVIDGASGWRIVALTRLTPIPFGLQNALFSLSEMGQLSYLGASVLGMSPMAVLYCYMGSTLRSMQDVLTQNSSTLTAYLVFSSQILVTVVLLYFVVRKARWELRKAMEQSDNENLLDSASDSDLRSSV